MRRCNMRRYSIPSGFEIVSYGNKGEMDEKHYIICSCGYIEPLIDDFESNAEKIVKDIIHLAETGEMKYYCPNCGKESRFSNGKREITLDYKRKKLIASIELKHGDELLLLKWINRWVVLDALDEYTEKIVFNFARGTTYLQLVAKNREIIISADITNKSYLLAEDPITNIFWDNYIFRDYIYECFERRCGGKLPIFEPDLMELIQINRFSGHDEEFIKSIPYMKHTYCIPDEFNCKAFRTKARAQQFIEELDFPKSIKKSLYKSPAYLFYLDELREIDRILLNDANVLYWFLENKKKAFEVLAAIKQYPCLLDYFEGFIKANGKHEFKVLVESFCLSVVFAALKYQLLNEHIKKREKEMFDIDRCFEVMIIDEYPDLYYSIPIKFYLPDWEYRYKNYTFKWLGNSNDFLLAGIELDNCLKEMLMLNNVMSISYNGKMIAAIELKDNLIENGFYARNRPIYENDDICEAIRAWCGQFGIIGVGTVIKKKW